MTSKKRVLEKNVDAIDCMKKMNVDVNNVGHGKNILEEESDEVAQRIQNLQINNKELKGLTMVCGSCYIPKNSDQLKKPEGGDAHFICGLENTIGVADGFEGIDHYGHEYAKELMNNAIIATENEPAGDMDPITILKNACSNTKCEGLCTACIVTLKGQCLHAVNVGNSGFMLFRGNTYVYRSRVQDFFIGNRSNGVDVADSMKIAVMPNDIMIAGTDGLFDNMDVELIEEELSRANERRLGPRGLAFRLAEIALANSLQNYPFRSSSSRAEHKRGRVDDITVIVGMII